MSYGVFQGRFIEKFEEQKAVGRFDPPSPGRNRVKSVAAFIIENIELAQIGRLLVFYAQGDSICKITSHDLVMTSPCTFISFCFDMQ